MRGSPPHRNGDKWQLLIFPGDKRKSLVLDTYEQALAAWGDLLTTHEENMKNQQKGHLQAEKESDPFSDGGRPCPDCGHPLELNWIYDALACRRCDRWQEPGCSDPSCWARCASRPARPSQSKESTPLPATADPTHFLHRLELRLGGSKKTSQHKALTCIAKFSP